MKIKKIKKNFKEYGGINKTQALALILIHYNENEMDTGVPYLKIRNAMKMKNQGQFSESVIGNLRHLGYIETIKNKDQRTKNAYTTDAGKKLVEKVLLER